MHARTQLVQHCSSSVSASAVFHSRSALRLGCFDVHARTHEGPMFGASIIGVRGCIPFVGSRIAPMRARRRSHGLPTTSFQRSIPALHLHWRTGHSASRAKKSRPGGGSDATSPLT